MNTGSREGALSPTRWRLRGSRYIARISSTVAIERHGVAAAGAQMRHLVRTVVYVTDLAVGDEVALAHDEMFGSIRPASTLVQVVALTPETAGVEIEVTAVVTE